MLTLNHSSLSLNSVAVQVHGLELLFHVAVLHHVLRELTTVCKCLVLETVRRGGGRADRGDLVLVGTSGVIDVEEINDALTME